MQALKDRILSEGKNLGSNILKVDGFINHQVDPALMDACGKAFADLFAETKPDRILTAEISGIAPAIMTAIYMKVPVVYARKTKPVTMTADVYLTTAPSHTKGHQVELIVSPEYLRHGERILIIDDFLASGATIKGLVRLVQAAGHELRTPLTSLRANIEFLQRAHDLPPDERDALLAGVRSEIEELGDLFDEVMLLATDDVTRAEPDTEIDLAVIVTEAVDRFRRRSEREVDLVVEPTIVIGNPTLLDRAVTNLLGNAHKFSPPNEPIEVSLSARRVTVRDHGPGIAPADLDRVFDRFYRADDARSQPGSGLGLAIVRQIAEQHGGTVNAENAHDGGAIVSFQLA